MEQNSGRNQRRIRNFLLQPLLQVKLGLYTLGLAATFSLAILLILYFSLLDFAEIVMALTDTESEIIELFKEYSATSQLWVLVLVLGFMICNVFVTIVYTHKLVGPTVAFRTQIRKLIQGEFDGEVYLRKNDAFQELASDINELSRILKENNGNLLGQEKNN